MKITKRQLRRIIKEERLKLHEAMAMELNLQLYDDDERNLEDLVGALQGKSVRVLVALGGPGVVAEISTDMTLEDIEVDPEAQSAIEFMKKNFDLNNLQDDGRGVIRVNFGGSPGPGR